MSRTTRIARRKLRENRFNRFFWVTTSCPKPSQVGERKVGGLERKCKLVVSREWSEINQTLFGLDDDSSDEVVGVQVTSVTLSRRRESWARGCLMVLAATGSSQRTGTFNPWRNQARTWIRGSLPWRKQRDDWGKQTRPPTPHRISSSQGTSRDPTTTTFTLANFLSPRRLSPLSLLPFCRLIFSQKSQISPILRLDWLLHHVTFGYWEP